MENWNRTGKTKAIILAVMALPNLLVPTKVHWQQEPWVILAPMVLISIFTPIRMKLFTHQEIEAPRWNENPLKAKKSLTWLQFQGYFFLTVGLSIVLGTAIKFQMINFPGLFSISIGLGCLIGGWLALK
jgi:hypothetical protein